MSRTRLVFLGTGTGEPSAERSASALAVVTVERSFLIDAGDGVAGNWVRYIGDTGGLEALFLTHLHADHVSGLPYLIQGMHLAKRTEPLALYSPSGAYGGIESFLSTVRLAPEKLGFDIEPRNLDDGEARIGEVAVRPFPNTHLPPDDSGRPRSYSLLLTTGGSRAVYSSDLGRLGDLDPMFESPVDLLIVEATHFPSGEIFEYLGGRPPKKLMFTHVPDDLDTGRLVAAGQKIGLAPVEIARDGLEVDWA